MERVIMDFETRLGRLRDWPDKNAIFELTSFGLRHPNISNHIADIIIARILDPSTPLGFKIPLFYLVDSVMRNVGGVYSNLFSAHIVAVIGKIFPTLSDKDKARLDFLLSTWEARKLLAPEVLTSLRHVIGPRIVRAAKKNKSAKETKLVEAFVQREMNRILDGMYDDMGVEDRMSLAELRIENSVLYDQLRTQAEAAVRTAPPSTTISAYIAESAVTLDMDYVQCIGERLKSWNGPSDAVRDLAAASQQIARRIETLASAPIPPLPRILLGPLSIENRKRKLQSDENDQSSSNKAKQTSNAAPLTKPVFKSEELGRSATKAVQTLYGDRPYYSRQDGLRFKTQKELSAHLDVLYLKNTENQKKESDRSFRRLFRPWFCTSRQWVTDFGALGNSGTSTEAQAQDTAEEEEEERIVPANEFFTRCPISNEAFSTFWDSEEGDYMYRNAVKVLCTENVDKNLFKLGQPTGHPMFHYAIVHQLLVMDGWIATGKAVSLASLVEKMRSENEKNGLPRDSGVVEALQAAISDDDVDVDIDDEDTFILVDSNGLLSMVNDDYREEAAEAKEYDLV